ncbi:MAG: hypothetical protein QNJ38_19810 [Prochloraceae cyanobacterium]|nr:hypothetical protein [Prochloraceae cyanobacterium]
MNQSKQTIISKNEKQLRSYIFEGVSVSIFGDSTTEQTSLAKKICLEERGIYLDLQLVKSEGEFKEYLAQELEIKSDFKWFRLKKIITNKKLLFLDKFENILSLNSCERNSLLGVLRALQQNKTFQFVISSQKSLDNLIPLEKSLTSVFYNVLIPLKFDRS